MVSIQIKNISDVTKALMNTTDSSAFLDVDQPVRLSKSMEALSDINKINAEWALRFTLPATERNNAIFEQYHSPRVFDRRDTEYSVLVAVNGNAINLNRLRYISMQADGTHEVELLQPTSHWLEQAKTKLINTIDLGTFTLTAANLDAGWQLPAYDEVEGNTTYWPLIDYGTWVDKRLPDQGTTNPVKTVAIEDFRPLVNLVALLKQGFCEIGWTFQCQLEEAERIRSLWAYLLKRDFYTVSTGGDCIIMGREDLVDWAYTPWSFIPVTALDYDPGANAIPYGTGVWMAGIQNPFPYRSTYRFIIEGFVQNNDAVPREIFFYVEGVGPGNIPNGEILTDDFIVELNASETRYIKVEMDCELAVDYKAAVRFNTTGNITLEKGYKFTTRPNQNAFTRGDVIEISKALEPYSLLDIFKGFLHLVNGRISADFITRTIAVFPQRTTEVDGEIVPGFVNIEDSPLDWTDIVIEPSIIRTPIRPTLKRYSRIQFAESTDAYVDSLNLPEPAHSRKVTNGDELPDEVTEYSNPFFEPTLDGQPTELKKVGRAPMPYIPRMWDNDQLERSFKIGPRVLFAYGKVRQVNPKPIAAADLYTAFYYDDAISDEIGFASMLRQWETDPAPAIDGNAVFSNKPNDLFNLFWLNTVVQGLYGERVNLLAFISMSDYQGFDFRRRLLIPYRGRNIIFEATDITDFQAGNNIPTPITGIIPASLSECCNLPCGCSFTECEYYQDLGVFMTQATLDDLKISSIILEGIQYVTTPISLGLLNIVNIGGLPYVTNLVDVLNALNLPYCSFQYSDREHSTKGLRYWKMKRPACWQFEIVIQSAGLDVYKYTDSTQQTKWFGAWANFGYGGDTIGVPENCVTTKEYL